MLRSLAVLLLALVLTGCGKSQELPGKPVDDSPQGRYFKALTNDLDAARDLAVPKSAAARYVGFQVQLAAAREQADVDPVETEVRRSADGYLLCEKGDGVPHCAEVTKVDLEGAKVRSFEVDGEPVRGRLAVAGKTVEAGAAGRVRLLTAYEQPATRELWILVRLVAGSADVSVHLPHGHYTSGGDKGTAVLQAGKLPVVAAGESALLAAVVPAGRLGGTLQLAFVVQGKKVFADLPVRR